MVKPIKATAKLVKKKELAPHILEFNFEMVKPKEIEFLPGQYVAIEIDPKTRRQYSIASSANLKNQFDLVVDTRPGGVGSKYLLSLRPGDEIKFIGQIGNFVLPQRLSKNLVFVATGTGISPLRSMIQYLVESNSPRDIYVYWGLRSINEAYYMDLFDEYYKLGKLKEFVAYYSRDETNRGYVTKFLDKIPLPFDIKKSQFFLCGNGQMIKDAEAKLLKLGCKKENVFYEKFY